MPEKKCVIGIAEVYTEDERYYGEIFDGPGFKACCATMSAEFLLIRSTLKDPSSLIEEPANKEGIYVRYLGAPVLAFGGFQMRFCPFCGAEIEVEVTSTKMCKEKKNLVLDGYEYIPYTPPNKKSIG